MTTPEVVGETVDGSPITRLSSAPPGHEEPRPPVATDLTIVDLSRQDHVQPCQDCGRTHLNGEHVTFTVPHVDGGERMVWEGCADCWEKRSRTPADRPTPLYVHRLLDALIYRTGVRFDPGMEVPVDVEERLATADEQRAARASGASRAERRGNRDRQSNRGRRR